MGKNICYKKRKKLFFKRKHKHLSLNFCISNGLNNWKTENEIAREWVNLRVGTLCTRSAQKQRRRKKKKKRRKKQNSPDSDEKMKLKRNLDWRKILKERNRK